LNRFNMSESCKMHTKHIVLASEKANPAVSVIVPFYNTEEYIAKCLNALITQTYANIEILLIDDASTDGSLKIAEEFAQKDKRIRILNQESTPPLTVKLGVAKARNLGLDCARGKYIMFCDSDDYYELNMVELMVKAMEDIPEADLACCSANVHQAGRIDDSIGDYFLNKDEGVIELTQEQKGRVTTCLWNKIFKKSIIDHYHICCRSLTPSGSDDGLSSQYLAVSSKIVYLVSILYNYVLRPNSIIGGAHNTKDKGLAAVLENFAGLADFLDENKLWPDNTDYYILKIHNILWMFPASLGEASAYLAAYRQLWKIVNRLNGANIVNPQLKRDLIEFQRGVIKAVPYIDLLINAAADERAAPSPIVSVIVPSHNTGIYLEQCLNSLKCQTYANLEILLIDDASSDNSLQTAMRLAEKDWRIRVVNMEIEPPVTAHRGLARVRNLGVGIARGKYIMACDSDDYFEPNMVEIMVNAMESNPEADLAICSAKVQHIGWEDKAMETYLTIKEGGLLDLTPVRKASEPAVFWDKIYKKSFFDAYNIRCRSFPSHGEDENFSAKYLAVSSKIFQIKDKLYNYVLRSDSIMGKAHKDYAKRSLCLMENMEDVAEFYNEWRLWAANTVYFAEKLKQFSWFFPTSYAEAYRYPQLYKLFWRLVSYINADELADGDLKTAVLAYKSGEVRGISFLPFCLQRADKEAERPLVSVIVPFFNTENELRKCLSALRDQSAENIEILLINDASTDASLNIAAEFCRNDKRFRLLNSEIAYGLTDKIGVARARDLGIGAARGKYIMFCDSDDYYELNMVELMSAVMEENPAADLASCSAEIHHIGWTEKSFGDYFCNKEIGLLDFTQERKMYETTCLWNKIFRRETFRRYGIRCNNITSLGEDECLTAKYFSVSDKIFHIEDKLYNYVLRANSIMGQCHHNLNARGAALLANFKDVAEFFTKNALWPHNAEYFCARLKEIAQLLSKDKGGIAAIIGPFVELSAMVDESYVYNSDLRKLLAAYKRGELGNVSYPINIVTWQKKDYKIFGLPLWRVKKAKNGKLYGIGSLRLAKTVIKGDKTRLYILGVKCVTIRRR